MAPTEGPEKFPPRAYFHPNHESFIFTKDDGYFQSCAINTDDGSPKRLNPFPLRGQFSVCSLPIRAAAGYGALLAVSFDSRHIATDTGVNTEGYVYLFDVETDEFLVEFDVTAHSSIVGLRMNARSLVVLMQDRWVFIDFRKRRELYHEGTTCMLEKTAVLSKSSQDSRQDFIIATKFAAAVNHLRLYHFHPDDTDSNRCEDILIPGGKITYMRSDASLDCLVACSCDGVHLLKRTSDGFRRIALSTLVCQAASIRVLDDRLIVAAFASNGRMEIQHLNPMGVKTSNHVVVTKGHIIELGIRPNATKLHAIVASDDHETLSCYCVRLDSTPPTGQTHKLH